MSLIKFVPLSLFVAYTVKTATLGATFEDGLVLLILAIISGFYEITPSYKKFEETKTELDNINKELKKLRKEHDDLSTHVAGLKMSKTRFTSVR